ncbi:MAG: hypothetical protein H6Q72_1898 [Firmicutes bacterium]|nr:hypothetical protein [Bacillota bacterium]
MAQNNMNVSELSALIESIVAKVLSNSFGEKLATWSANQAKNSLYLSRETGKRDWGNAGEVTHDLGQLGSLINKWPKASKEAQDFGKSLSGVAGIANAYESGDALSGALSGAALGPWGVAAGLLAGLLSPGIDRWQRPKFKKAKQAFDKIFSMDRGERDEYYLPDSFYFRAGSNIPRSLVVRVNDKKFDEHVGESLTNSYAAQLQRGLVF